MAYQRRLRLEFLERRQLFAADIELGSASTEESNGSTAEGVRAAEVRIQFDPEKVSPKRRTFCRDQPGKAKGRS